MPDAAAFKIKTRLVILQIKTVFKLFSRSVHTGSYLNFLLITPRSYSIFIVILFCSSGLLFRVFLSVKDAAALYQLSVFIHFYVVVIRAKFPVDYVYHFYALFFRISVNI